MRFLVTFFAVILSLAAEAQAPVQTVPLSPPPSALILEGAQSLGTSPNDLEVDEVTLLSVPALAGNVSGDTRRIAELITARLRNMALAMGTVNLSAAGPTMVVFDQLSNSSFRAQIMIPLITKPDVAPPSLSLAMTPAGKAVRIIHRGVYDDIDATYDELSSFIEDRDIAVEDVVIERYIGDVTAGPNARTIEILTLKK